MPVRFVLSDDPVIMTVEFTIFFFDWGREMIQEQRQNKTHSPSTHTLAIGRGARFATDQHRNQSVADAELGFVESVGDEGTGACAMTPTLRTT